MISEFPLFVFTTLAGLSAGAYVASAAFPVGGRENAGVALAGKAGGLGGPDGVGAAGAVGADARGARPWLFPLVCLALLGLGLVGCLGHLARPALFLNALVNPRAGIAQEAYLSIAYGVLLLLVECIVVLRGKKSSRILSLACAVAAVGLTVVMGMAYLANLGTPAWVSWATVPLFVLGDALMGFALYPLFSGWAYRKTAFFGIFMAIGGCGRFSGRPRRPAPAASCGRLSYRTPCALPRRTPSASPPGTSGSTRRARRRTARRRPRASPSRGRTRP